MLGKAAQRLGVIARRRAGPRGDRAVVQRQAFVGGHQLGVEVHLRPQPVAGGACPERVVERKQPRFDLVDGEAGNRACELGRKHRAALGHVVLDAGLFFVPVRADAACFVSGGHPRPRGLPRGLLDLVDEGEAVGEVERGLETVGEPRFQAFAHHQPVDHDFDVMLVFLVQRRRFLDVVQGAVDAHALEPALGQRQQFLFVFALAAADDGRQQVEPRALVHRHHPVDHFADRLAFDRQAGGRRMVDADAGKHKPHVVVDLGHRADGGARVARRGLLLDGDRRA